MFVSIVKNAKIEVVRPNELKVGDYILWSCCKAKILTLSSYDYKEFALIQLFPEDKENTIIIPRYIHFYKIINSKLEKNEV